MINFCKLVYKEDQKENKPNLEEVDYWNLDLKNKFHWKLNIDEMCALADVLRKVSKVNLNNDIKEDLVSMNYFVNQWSQCVNEYVSIREKKREEDKLYMKAHHS